MWIDIVGRFGEIFQLFFLTRTQHTVHKPSEITVFCHSPLHCIQTQWVKQRSTALSLSGDLRDDVELPSPQREEVLQQVEPVIQ